MHSFHTGGVSSSSLALFEVAASVVVVHDGVVGRGCVEIIEIGDGGVE